METEEDLTKQEVECWTNVNRKLHYKYLRPGSV